MRETDISKFTEHGTMNLNSESTVKRVLKAIGRGAFTLLMVGVITGAIVGISLIAYVIGIASEPTGIDLKAKSLNQTSFIYVRDDSGKFKKYQSLYDTENRVWVDFKEIPQNMKNAVIAIEDKRFEEHHGVDFTRTMGAILNLASGKANYGGSTLTQQLIKNISDDNEVSLNRKIREIVKALKLETEYTKDEILEAYLNVVNFGNNCQGVEAAANLYFGCHIDKCTLAQCAAIAGITQNPSRFNPLIYPDENKGRRELVLSEMLDQGKITQAEYDEAMKQSANMEFVGYKKSNKTTVTQKVQNWYIDELQNDLTRDLAVEFNISEKAASDKLFTEGLKVYCAMDTKMQTYMENAAMNIDTTYDSGLQCAATLMDLNGAIIATVGSSQEKTSNLLFDRATDSVLQPGSSIKPVVVYSYAIEKGDLYYSSVVKDKPVDRYYANGDPGPENWYLDYKGNMLLPDAIEWSANATAAQVMEMISPAAAYNQVVTLQGFEHLNEADRINTGGLSIGGLNGGVTVREMAAAFTYMGNGGKYYKPYTYYYVTDSEDNIILDNRDQIPKEAYSPETAYIMNRLLHYNITNCAHTNAYLARVDGWDIVGKTGTTDEDKDSWFCGLSPYASLAVWTGFDTPQTISVAGQQTATTLFSDIMGHYLEGKKAKEYSMPGSIVMASFDPSTGVVYNVGDADPDDMYTGYYVDGNLPEEIEEYVDYNEYVEEEESYETEAVEEESEAEEEGGEDETEAPSENADIPEETEAEPEEEPQEEETEAEPEEEPQQEENEEE